jgi:hypothetical protein
MITYKDKTFCASKVKKHTCGREFTKEDEVNAKRVGLPVAYGNFCKSINHKKQI